VAYRQVTGAWRVFPAHAARFLGRHVAAGFLRGGRAATAGLLARMIALCISGAASRMNVTPD
jgi:hypothetical protein